MASGTNIQYLDIWNLRHTASLISHNSGYRFDPQRLQDVIDLAVKFDDWLEFGHQYQRNPNQSIVLLALLDRMVDLNHREHIGALSSSQSELENELITARIAMLLRIDNEMPASATDKPDRDLKELSERVKAEIYLGVMPGIERVWGEGTLRPFEVKILPGSIPLPLRDFYYSEHVFDQYLDQTDLENLMSFDGTIAGMATPLSAAPAVALPYPSARLFITLIDRQRAKGLTENESSVLNTLAETIRHELGHIRHPAIICDQLGAGFEEGRAEIVAGSKRKIYLQEKRYFAKLGQEGFNFYEAVHSLRRSGSFSAENLMYKVIEKLGLSGLVECMLLPNLSVGTQDEYFRKAIGGFDEMVERIPMWVTGASKLAFKVQLPSPRLAADRSTRARLIQDHRHRNSHKVASIKLRA